MGAESRNKGNIADTARKCLIVLSKISPCDGNWTFFKNNTDFLYKYFNVDYLVTDGTIEEKERQRLAEKGSNIYSINHLPGLKNYIKRKHNIENFYSKHPDYDLIISSIKYSTTYFVYKCYKKTKKIFFSLSVPVKQRDPVKKLFVNYQRKYINDNSVLRFACSKTAGKDWFNGYKYSVLPNTIPYKEYRFDSDERSLVRKTLGIRDNQILLGFVGRFEYIKNPGFAIDLLAQLPTNYRLVYIGKGSLKNSLIQKAKELELENHVLFVDESSKIARYYAALDALIVPSLNEGFCYVLLEGQINGLNCYVSDTIPDDAVISQNVKFISLKDMETWVKEIKTANRNQYQVLNDKYDTNRVGTSEFEDKVVKILDETK